MAQVSTELQLRSVRSMQRYRGLVALTTVAAALSALFDSLVKQRDDLKGQLTQLLAAVPGLRLISARPPGVPVRPHPIRSTLLGVLVGFAFGVLLAVGLEVLDRRLLASDEWTPAPAFVP